MPRAVHTARRGVNADDGRTLGGEVGATPAEHERGAADGRRGGVGRSGREIPDARDLARGWVEAQDRVGRARADGPAGDHDLMPDSGYGRVADGVRQVRDDA